ncbi:MAG: hypothetical protein K6B28_04350 [Lachnospiraceae bacterium]|nr:hypothetical protein [Lachnospiraceae bacterium]
MIRRKRLDSGIITAMIVIPIALIIVVVLSRMLYYMPYGTLSLKQCYSVAYGGYNNKGNLIITLNEEFVREKISEFVNEYESKVIKRDIDKAGYDALVASISVESSKSDNLTNGQKIDLNFSCDEELAKELGVKITGRRDQITVAGLQSGIFLTLDDLFKGISVTFSGISPDIVMEIKNNSIDPYIKEMKFEPTESKDTYSEGDVVRIRAIYNEDEALARYYSIDTPSEECIKEYVVTGVDSYVSDASDISEDILEEAIHAGKMAFSKDSANEYGVRVFTEAGLTPVYDSNKNETFSWVSPSESTAYFKTARTNREGETGVDHNILDIVYICTLTQANGVSTKTFCAVRFKDYIKSADGSIKCDLTDPHIISASHIAERVRTTIVDSAEGDYEVVKLR